MSPIVVGLVAGTELGPVAGLADDVAGLVTVVLMMDWVVRAEVDTDGWIWSGLVAIGRVSLARDEVVNTSVCVKLLVVTAKTWPVRSP